MAGKQTRKSTTSKVAKTTKAKGVSGQTKAGLIFAPARCARLLRAGRFSERVGSSAGVFMAGCLEYLVRELLEIAGD